MLLGPSLAVSAVLFAHRRRRRAAAAQRDRDLHVRRADAQRGEPHVRRASPSGSASSGQVFVFFVMTVAAAEAAVGLAIILAIYRHRETVNLQNINLLQGLTTLARALAWSGWCRRCRSLGFLLNGAAGALASRDAKARSCRVDRRRASLLASVRASPCWWCGALAQAHPPRPRWSFRYWSWMPVGDSPGRARAPGGPAVGGDDAGRHGRRLADPRLQRRLHARGPRVRALLRVPQSVRLLHAGAGARRQLPGDVRRLGRRRALLLPADRVLVHARR